MMSFAVLAIVKSTLVCGVALFLARVCRRTRASIRHVLFALAFAALVAAPVAGLVMPTVSVPVPATATVQAPRIHGAAPAALPSSGAGPAASGTPSVSRDTTPARLLTIAQLVTIIWLTGVALFLTPVVVGAWQMRRLRHDAASWVDGQALAATLAPTIGMHRQIDVALHDAVTGPMTCGVWRPSIILPSSAQRWDTAALRSALTHELAHVARWDFLTHSLSRMICAAYWFHPLVWAAWRRLRLEAERACDDAVLREDDPKDYASLLVSIAQCERAETRQPFLTMAGRGDLAARVAAVLDDGQARGPVGHRWAAGMIVMGTAVILGIAPITVVRANPQTQPSTTTASPLRFETVSIKRNTSGGAERWARLFDGEMTATNITVRTLLFLAHGRPDDLHEIHQPHQIENAPEWVDSDRFDILATSPRGATASRARAGDMLRSLLADRFRLETHRGSKEFPIYALVLSRPDGRPGPRLTPSQLDCRSKPGESSPCGLSGTVGRLVGRGITMAQLVHILPKHVAAGSRIGLDRPLIDRTNLSGAFDFTLEWTPDPVAPEISAPSQAALSPYRAYTRPLELNAPNFLAALPEQLGLRFDNQLAPAPVLVIDRIEPPVEN